jgi:hypothetical protein
VQSNFRGNRKSPDCAAALQNRAQNRIGHSAPWPASRPWRTHITAAALARTPRSPPAAYSWSPARRTA